MRPEYFEDISDAELIELGLGGLEKFATSMSLEDFRQIAKYISRLDLESDIERMIYNRRPPQNSYERAIIGNAWYKRPISKAEPEVMDAYVQYKQSGQVHRDNFRTVQETWENVLPDELYNDLIEEKINGEAEDKFVDFTEPAVVQEVQEFMDSGEIFFNTPLQAIYERFGHRISLADWNDLVTEWRKGEPSFIEETAPYVLDEIQELFDSPEFPQMTMEEVGWLFRHKVSESDWNRIHSRWNMMKEDQRGVMGGDMEGWVRTELNTRADAWFPDLDPEDTDARFRLRRRMRGQYVRFRNSQGLTDTEETVNMFLDKFEKQLGEDGDFGVHPLDTEEDLKPLYVPNERELDQVTQDMAMLGRHITKREAQRIIMLRANVETPYDPVNVLEQNELALDYVQYVNTRDKLDTSEENIQYTPEEAMRMAQYRPEVFLLSIPYLYPSRNTKTPYNVDYREIPYSVDYAILSTPVFGVTSGNLGAFYDAVYLNYGQYAEHLKKDTPGVIKEIWKMIQADDKPSLVELNEAL